MAYLVEISDSKIDKMSEYVEDMLWAGGELMHCLEKMKGESGYGHRDDKEMNYRGGRYGNRNEDMTMRGGRGGYMGYRDDEDDDEWEEMQERRGGRRRRDSRGRYM